MSIIHVSNIGWFICHEKFINGIYSRVDCDSAVKSFMIAHHLFEINYPYKRETKRNLKRKSPSESDPASPNYKELKLAVHHVQENYKILHDEIKAFLESTPTNDHWMNKSALELAAKVYEVSGKNAVLNSVGENTGEAKVVKINNCSYLFPKNSKFYCRNVTDIDNYLIDSKFDLIVLDPPWWNKYVRRKKAKTDHGYQMMYNDDLQSLPIENLVEDDGLVVVWCTNSTQHLEFLLNVIFPKWNLNLLAKWYWLKITKSGEPICYFAEPPRKQPFEQIIIGCKNSERSMQPEDGKLVVSVPSALHSHKPPLIDILKSYLNESPKCLEIFARYLLPDWISWGFEALRFQHDCLYELG